MVPLKTAKIIKKPQKHPPPLVIYQRLKSGGVATSKIEKFDNLKGKFSAARLLAPYALIDDIG